VLLRGRDLHGFEARGAEHVLALGGNVGPRPFKELHEYVAGGTTTRGAVVRRERWTRTLRARSSAA